MELIFNMGYQDKKSFFDLMFKKNSVFTGVLLTNGIYNSFELYEKRINDIRKKYPDIKIYFDSLTYTTSFFDYSKYSENKIIKNDKASNFNLLIFKNKLAIFLKENEIPTLIASIKKSVNIQKELKVSTPIISSIVLNDVNVEIHRKILKSIENETFFKESLITIAISGKIGNKSYEYLNEIAKSIVKGIYLVHLHNENSYSYGQEDHYDEQLVKISKIFKNKKIFVGFGESEALIAKALNIDSLALGYSFTLRKLFRSSRFIQDDGKQFNSNVIKHKIFSKIIKSVIVADNVWPFKGFKEKHYPSLSHIKNLAIKNYKESFLQHIDNIVESINEIKDIKTYQTIMQKAIKNYEEMNKLIKDVVLRKPKISIQ